MAVREGLLALLDDGPRHGYQLKTQFEQVTGGVWALNVGQVYTTLDRLERDGLVAATPAEPGAARSGAGGGPQRQYSLTPAGREELGAWWHAVPSDDPPPRDELMLKVLMAIEHGRDHALGVITRQRSALQTLMQQARRGQRDRRRAAGAAAAAVEGVAAALVADAVAVRAEADLRWLDLCEARLADLPGSSGSPRASGRPGAPGSSGTSGMPGSSGASATPTVPTSDADAGGPGAATNRPTGGTL